MTDSGPDNKDASLNETSGRSERSPDDSLEQLDTSATLAPHERRTRRTSVAMVVITVLLVLYTVYFARTVLMPIVAAVLLALLFRPVVRRLKRYRIPETVGGALVIGVFVVVAIGLFANLVGPAKTWLEDAPENLRDVGEKLHVIRKQVSDLNRASEMVEEIASGDVESEQPPPDTAPFPFAPDPPESGQNGQEGHVVSPDSSDPSYDDPANNLAEATDKEAEEGERDEPIAVEVQQPRLLAGLQVLSSTGSILGEFVVMTVLAYFLLAAGDVLINNVLRILPSFREKRNTVELVRNVEKSISAYLLTVTVINVILGVVIGIAMWLLGLPTPMLWGVMATVFNFVPFLGAMCGAVVVFFVSVLTFDSLGYAVVPPLVFFAITSTEGHFITPHIVGRSMSLNPIVVFLSLTVWGWMWGIGGAFLAVPILAVLKVGFDQFERTRYIGLLLSGHQSE